MAIGTREQLKAASQGVLANKNRQDEKVPGVPETWNQAQSYISELAQSRAQRGPFAGIPESVYKEPMKPYADVYGQLSRSGAGLSDKGKYGGFFTSADLEQAISGSALGFREDAARELRRAAMDRMTKVGEMYRGARKPFDMALFKGTVDSPKGGQKFLSRLGDWYKQQSKPAEEYLQSAQQIDYTPLSQLASDIAVRQYGMNPNLARAKFANVDSDFWKAAQNQRYMQEYGVPYDEYMAGIQAQTAAAQQQKSALSAESQQRSDLLAQQTGYDPKVLAQESGRNVDQLYSIWYNNRQPVENTIAALSANDLNLAKSYAEEAAAQNNMALRDLIVAMIKQAYKASSTISNMDFGDQTFKANSAMIPTGSAAAQAAGLSF